ncbi:MAG: UvrD-helicase domain-containing protein [Deltaproteobacteria bacterium]|jgi:DNA helicase-2/ATP-dependent DNA helicase PcrA|nr:UvrD-helicase domain-containing protein [Deltaproteobacteria bacterium]MBW2533902.1 UvrD-helicase domain-containing protein [Deltaproteobacteria bacterium]
MEFYADLHLHSKYSRATAKSCDLEHLALWARKKGIAIVGTGDFTHPGWRAELGEGLLPAEPGLFRLTPELQQRVDQAAPRSCDGDVRFLLSAEISTIYKKAERTRKVHHVIYAPDLERADRIAGALDKIGNIKSDGRPILGLDSRDLLEIVLEAGAECYLIPAHIWTPWFSALGSKSGFDSIDDCYGDLASHIFAVETGLSSDPAMNWQVASLDRFRLVSNSDAHSPPMLGREACIFDGDRDYFGLRRALETGAGYVGTVEFFPEEGKYHLDGHRNCGVRLSPSETRELAGRCPECGKPVTVGVMHRVAELADRDEGNRAPTAGEVRSFVPLPEILGELRGVGPKSKTVQRTYEALLHDLGPELAILGSIPIADLRRVGGELFGEAITRLRAGKVIRQAGYDGEYGVIRLFEEAELEAKRGAGELFPGVTAPLAASSKKQQKARRKPAAAPPSDPPAPAPIAIDGSTARGSTTTEPPTASERTLPLFGVPASAGEELLARLDESQRAAAQIHEGPLLIVAGPGSGKTRTLTHRIAHLITHRSVAPDRCLAITFTRRAAAEMTERLEALLPAQQTVAKVATFHRLGLTILREHPARLGLDPDFGVADAAEQSALLSSALEISPRRAATWLRKISLAKRTGTVPVDPELGRALDTYRFALRERNRIDFDDLVCLPTELLESDEEIRQSYRDRFRYVSIDEFQDVDAVQYRLVRTLVPPGGNLCAIGDPDQAIYGFRGADVAFFRRFCQDYPTAQVVHLDKNYRSAGAIVNAAAQVIETSHAVGDAAEAGADADRVLAMKAVRAAGDKITIHEARSDRAEAEFVVHTIEQLLGGHSFFSVDSGRTDGVQGPDLSFADIAILYRTAAQAAPLREALERSGMPYRCRSHDTLADQPGVRELCERACSSNTPGSVLHKLRAAFSAATAPVASDGTTEPAPPKKDALPSAEALERALELLTPLAERCGDDVPRLATALALGAELDSWDPRADQISLLTLHAAKGLEFEVVFLVGCEDGILPLRFAMGDDEDLDEERRLFYVGMTRAQHRLLLCHARKRRWRGKVREAEASPFLRAIEEELVLRSRTRPDPKSADRDRNQLKLF